MGVRQRDRREIQELVSGGGEKLLPLRKKCVLPEWPASSICVLTDGTVDLHGTASNAHVHAGNAHVREQELSTRTESNSAPDLLASLYINGTVFFRGSIVECAVDLHRSVNLSRRVSTLFLCLQVGQVHIFVCQRPLIACPFRLLQQPERERSSV